MNAPKASAEVVLAPDLFVAALIDPRARAVLQSWRDGRIIPVTNRDLVVHCLRALRGLSLPANILSAWALWLSHPEKTISVRAGDTAPAKIAELCESIAGERPIICARRATRATRPDQWIMAANWAAR